MRAHITKATAVLILTVFFGIPWGLYNKQFIEDARAMSQEQWLDMMEYTQSSYEYSTGFTGTLIAALILFTAFVCIYEFAKLVAGMFIDRVLGPEKSGYIKSLTQ
jgi:hypothetical protein